jgi:HEAT repeat protein
MIRRFLWILALVLLPAVSFGAPLSRDEFERQQQVLARLREVVETDASDGDKSATLRRVVSAETDPNLRRHALKIAIRLGSEGREAFLLSVLATDSDAGVRSEAAKLLGEHGSEQALTLLGQTAASDRTSQVQIGDIYVESSARRAATFALAELAQRHPVVSKRVIEVLQALPDVEISSDRESLYDARRQALYQLTHDDQLLAPFRRRLASDDPRQRERGVMAFRFLKLQVAPPEIVEALHDADQGVRSYAALVLGEIGDERTAARLVEIAINTEQERTVRANAIFALGQMRAAGAAESLEKLLADPAVSAVAAVYRITGKKTAQFPAGYDADDPRPTSPTGSR